MDGLFHGKPYEQMDDLGGNTPILETIIYSHVSDCQKANFNLSATKNPSTPWKDRVLSSSPSDFCCAKRGVNIESPKCYSPFRFFLGFPS